MSTTTPMPTALDNDTLQWRIVDSADVSHGRLEHAELEVPMDYSRPDGPSITLALSRIRAHDSRRRRGALIALNGGPGGDGGLGRNLPVHLAGTTPLADRYDLVGVDPRGTGDSTRLEGEDSPVSVPFDSRPPDDLFDALAADMAEREAGCRRAGGNLRPHVSTNNNARDLDAIRTALGEDRISFVGWAYGSMLGAVYGTLFPERLDRTVLDSCVHPGWDWRRQFRSQAEATRLNVDAWADWAADRPTALGLGSSAGDVIAAVEKVAADLEAVAQGPNLRTTFDLVVGNWAALRPRWHDLAALVSSLTDAAAAGDRERAGQLLSGVLPWRPGTPAGTRREAVLEAVTSESDWPSDPAEYHAGMRDFRERCPYGLGVMRTQPWVGTFRSFTPPEPPTAIAAGDYPTGLIVQADRDPLDHYQGALAMADRTGHALVWITDSGDHEIYGMDKNREVDDIVNRYLLNGDLPDSARVEVAGDPRPDVPTG